MCDVSQRELSYLPELAEVVKASKMTDTEIFLALKMADGRPLGHTPGQFAQVSIFGVGEAPISLCSSPTRPESFEVCVRAAGNLTRAVHRLSAGGWVGIRGPFGAGFPVAEMKGKDILIVAGGIGLAPLRSVIDYVLDNRDEYRRLIVVCGARDPSAMLFRDEIKEWDESPEVESYVTVDEPDETWSGRTGVVTQPLRQIDIEPENTMAAVVGPLPAFRFVAMELLEKEMEPENIYFSLERRFKCGIGKCGHCQLNDLYVCQDGPVFRLSELLKRTEAIEAWAPERDQD